MEKDEHDKPKQSDKNQGGSTGAHGSSAPPKGGEEGPKWRGGNEKGEGEKAG